MVAICSILPQSVKESNNGEHYTYLLSHNVVYVTETRVCFFIFQTYAQEDSQQAGQIELALQSLQDNVAAASS